MWRGVRRAGLYVDYLSSLSPHSVCVSDTTAAFLYPDKQEFERITTLGEESAITEDLLENVRSDDTVWDIGANVGL